MAVKFELEEMRGSLTLQAESVARHAEHGLPAKHHPINLSKGWPAPELHPAKALNNATGVVLTNKASSTPALQYGPDPGYQPLRESISSWLSQYYSAEDDPTRIVITGGASQNLANVLAGFTDCNITKRIWMGCPTYYLASRIFEDAGFAGRLRAVPEDEGGLDLEYLAKELEKLKDEEPRGPPTKTSLPWRKTYSHIIYCVPTFSNPSTHTMKESRRRALVKLASQHNALSITDDVYDFLHWPTKDTLAPSYIDVSAERALILRCTDIERNTHGLVDPDGFGFTMSNGSFSKILAPGVRTGWADCNPKLAHGISQVGATKSGGAPSQMTAAFIDQMIRKRVLQTHIAKVLCPAYQRRWKVMMEAIQMSLAPLGVTVEEAAPGRDVMGGFFVWVRLPDGMDSDVVAWACQEEFNLTVSPGSLFAVAGETEVNQKKMLKPCIRLCFAYEDIKDGLVEGVFRLGHVVTELKNELGAPMNLTEVMAVTGLVETTTQHFRWFLDLPDSAPDDGDGCKVAMTYDHLERLLPSVGSGLRRLIIRGVADEVSTVDTSAQWSARPWAALKELDELVKQARIKHFGEGQPTLTEAQRAAAEKYVKGLHAACRVDGPKKRTVIRDVKVVDMNASMEGIQKKLGNKTG